MAMYPSIGQPPFNCNVCGSRTLDQCSRHRSENTGRIILIDKYLGMSVRRHAALSEANAAHIPPHDPSGVISDPLSSGDSEMQGRLPRGEEFVPDERGRTASEVAK